MATLDVLTLTEAKEALNLTGTTQYDATELPAWITGVSARLDELVGPVVRRTVTSELHDGGGYVIRLRYYPVASISTVTEYSGTTATTLTAETHASKPDNGYAADPYSVPVTLATGTQVDLFGNALRRRAAGADRRFTAGRHNIEVSYVAGRFANTAAVTESFKRAAALMLLNVWRSQQDAVGNVGEFDVPQSIFPRFVVPAAVRQMFPREIQDTHHLVG